eukprot:m.15075 g.15075  ORF g.15075 m.15075 type:complete len:67 (+) comp10425_c0_seq1:112-312(+)
MITHLITHLIMCVHSAQYVCQSDISPWCPELARLVFTLNKFVVAEMLGIGMSPSAGDPNTHGGTKR